MTQKPLKRHQALQPLSRQHHHGLLLSWKIRAGFKKKIEPQRMKVYADWFFKTHLTPHFETEETYIFPILEQDNERVKKALADHGRIRRLFAQTDNDAKTLSNIEVELDKHIRFEERILFPEIQEMATEAQLLYIEKIHTETEFIDKHDDAFWT